MVKEEIACKLEMMANKCFRQAIQARAGNLADVNEFVAVTLLPEAERIRDAAYRESRRSGEGKV